jgi:hypothetical protein
LATSRPTIATALAGFALVGLLLSGCSAGESDTASSDSSPEPKAESSSQTTEEACSVLKGGVSGTMQDLQAGLTELQTDPAAASAAVGTLAAAFEDTAADVKNTDVRAVADDATDALNAFDMQIAAYAADPASVDPAAVQNSATAVQEVMVKLGATCP